MADFEKEPLYLQEVEDKVRYEAFSSTTEDHEDHSFNGVMFDVACLTVLPVDSVEVNSLWIRGELGTVTVWAHEKGSHIDVFDQADEWKEVYKKFHEPSFDTLVEIKLKEPVVIKAGEMCGLYIHSDREDDMGIVYDNQRRARTEEDNDRDLVAVSPALAHLSAEAFGSHAPWGGHAWRPRREFVGRICFGARYLKWHPKVHHLFPPQFRKAALAFLCGINRRDCELYWLRQEHGHFILNMCPHDWFGLEGLEEAREKDSEARLGEQRARGEARRRSAGRDGSSSDDDDEGGGHGHGQGGAGMFPFVLQQGPDGPQCAQQ